ncbi:D-3-phosphoglycerate dehydrogenase (EC [Olavius sp. associated proteobacterium Delta 1]|nr:D-3-phosphoglycerate dehydrogenase (EC [Olavius sp. associated proteobacterium Delta 1]
MEKPRLLYYDILQYHSEVLDFMESHFEVHRLADPNHDRDEILTQMDICMAPLGYLFDRKKIQRCRNLKVIASSTLSVPHIDIEYAESKRIKVCWLSESEKEFLDTITPTAELCWGLIIALTRKIPWAHRASCRGEWKGREFGRETPRMLSRMNLGIIGLGRLGSLVASYGTAFGMKVYYYSPNTEDSSYQKCNSLLDLAKKSDIVSIHAHHTAETEKLLGMDFFKNMKPGSYLVNTARGAIVDEEALLVALESGHLGGAALDVLAVEYELDFKARLAESPLVAYAKNHNNVLITPHYGGATIDAWVRTQKRTLELIIGSLP